MLRKVLWICFALAAILAAMATSRLLDLGGKGGAAPTPAEAPEPRRARPAPVPTPETPPAEVEPTPTPDPAPVDVAPEVVPSPAADPGSEG